VLVQAATFEAVRSSAERLIPTSGILKSNAAFFRRGSSGAGREILGEVVIAASRAQGARLAPPCWPGSARQANDLWTHNDLRLQYLA
jgi:aryl sulfotransferase